jgi:Replication stress response SDE2 C-terminal
MELIIYSKLIIFSKLPMLSQVEAVRNLKYLRILYDIYVASAADWWTNKFIFCDLNTVPVPVMLFFFYRLKSALMALGLKCGGTLQERAER